MNSALGEHPLISKYVIEMLGEWSLAQAEKSALNTEIQAYSTIYTQEMPTRPASTI